MSEACPPTLAAAQARIAALHPAAYARSRNAIGGAVSGLSPYISHGLLTLPEVLAGVAVQHAVGPQHKFVFELAWREYFRHVWAQRGSAILRSLHPGPLPDEAYARSLPADIRQASTGVPVIDQAVQTLYATGLLHNHARMWLASYVVHLRKVHWRVGADWLYGHLLDGDLASNHLSWQWVAGTGSHKPYLFNAANVARYAPAPWHSPGSVLDTSYEALDALARRRPAAVSPAQPLSSGMAAASSPPLSEPTLCSEPPQALGARPPAATDMAGHDVWLVHPWSLGALPADLPADTVRIGLCVADFHRAWPWSERRWRFVAPRLAELAPLRWHGSAAAIGAALHSARRVRCMADPHLAPWLPAWVESLPTPTLFAPLDQRCDSFSPWWARVSKAGLLAPLGTPP